jgi:hypothetical protein
MVLERALEIPSPEGRGDGMKILFVARFGPIVRDPQVQPKTYIRVCSGYTTTILRKRPAASSAPKHSAA